MKKVLFLITILCVTMVFFAGCDLFTPSNPETPCEHDWVDATCTTPKTCSLCGEAEGEALGHNAIEVFGQAPTCTEPGQTNFVYCDVCDKNLSEAKEIAPLGHTEETVAGKAPTCTEVGKTDGKKCSVCGVTTVEQTDIEALGHTSEADDGDVTTAVVCANGCGHIFVEAKEAITLTIPTFENGAVIADKMNYAIGDTVKLTVNPDWGYAQKLYINGEALILDWNNNIYTFVAQKDTYVISGSFEQGLALNPADPARWETGNQAHGIISTRYTVSGHNNESYWFDFTGNYSAISVKAKNFLSLEDSKDGDGKTGFSFVLRISLDNGKFYAFRIINDKGTYAFDKFGASGSATGWGNWQALDSVAAAALNDNGVDFKLERTSGNTLTLSVNGTAIFTYTMDGVTAENKVTSVGLRHYGNIDVQVDIPFDLTNACEHAWDAATCTTPKTCSKCGETVGTELGHSYTNYTSNNDATCTEDGTKTAQCDNCTEKNTVVDTGSAGHKNNNDDYKCDVCGANLCTDHKPEADDGDCTTAIKCSVCGTITTEAKGSHTPEADDGDLATAVKCSNDGCDHICVPAIVIPTFENGTVTTDKTSYNVGDTVTLTITPNSNYFQKLYINGEPLILKWKEKNTYSFIATENAYEITGSFEPTLEMYAGDWKRWDNNNHAHGIITSYYPKENDGWWFKIKGDYDSFAVTAKNYRTVENSYEGSAEGPWRIVMYMQFDNGEYYAFTMWIDSSKRYVYNHCDFKIAGEKNSVTGSGGAWRNLVEVNAEATAALNGDGAEFKLERINGYQIQVTFGGTVLETYTISGVTAENKVVSVGLHHYGNKGEYVDIPFEVK